MLPRTEKYQPPSVTEYIDGIPYTSAKFPASRALRLLARTVQILGEHGLQALVAAKAAAVAENAPRLVLQTQPRLYGAMVQVAYGVAQDPELPRELCANLKVGESNRSKPGAVADVFDTHFSGELYHLFQVLSFVLAHNFMGFTLGEPSIPGSPGPAETNTGEKSSSESPSAE